NLGQFGFGLDTSKDRYDSIKRTIEDAVKRVFNPEFLNRIDDTIIFHNLEREHIMQIIDIQMKDLVKRMTSMNITLELTRSAKEFLGEKGFDPTLGARPLKRALQRYVEDALAEEILRGKFADGSRVKIAFNKKTNELKFADLTKKGGEVQAPEEEAAEL
ncbi:MAG: ATP-dependent Clp protease ATP-binding subunit, partial [Bacteroidota bacterium]